MTVEYHEGPCIITNAEDGFMETAYELFKEVESTEIYFSIAPEFVLKIRQKIHDQVTAYLNTYNSCI